ncbi:galactose oxidase [Aspergillus flavus]|uniref:Galactose oxidase n=1 Tax=Aspergillus flavus (strain ATCC 200026 / FGSC A1120 / IAM 13836 / NRRL 3357 / JCM 12722 / SRRC 167) TaxID=332952 RepID=A0A7U2MPC6_ASPFN|nr:galactose oxidase [Aspergillus flavus]
MKQKPRMGLKWASVLLLIGLSKAEKSIVHGSLISAVAQGASLGIEGSGAPVDTGGENTGLYQSPPYNSARIDRSSWIATCDSELVGHECINAIDGDNSTYWHSGDDTNGIASLPHNITINLGTVQNVSGIAVWPRAVEDGWIGTHDVSLSTDGVTWGDPVAHGAWWPDSTVKLAVFEPKAVQYVRLIARSSFNGDNATSIADLQIWSANSIPTAPQGKRLSEVGAWGPTIDFPLVPASAAIEPSSGKVLVWSSYRKNQYGGTSGGLTQTATWDPNTGVVSRREVSDTEHDMFCSGISMDVNGRVIVTGGNDDTMTSIYDSFSDSWIAGAPMNVERGYQASTILSDGNMFVLGGSWNGPQLQNKNSEVYNVTADTWTQLPNAGSQPMLTHDNLGPYHADNHGWIFGWKNLSIFHAGPSQAMHWYFAQGVGNVTNAGNRSTDYDQMSGNAVMFDATGGRILTFGGSPNYEDSDATKNATLITIGDPNTPPVTVKAGGDMGYARTFHTSVVLPDGSVFITGGQAHGLPFNEDTAQLTPERYIPEEDRFVEHFPNNIVRVYHSWSLLLPDATVINGGGGLCANCTANHYDAQIYTPPYLFDADGNRAPRPHIETVAPASLRYGGQITITADSPISNASLIRYGTTTHTVNTDQRRIELVLEDAGTNMYTADIPNDPGVALPGYYMLFVMNANGVPSVSKNVQITL